VAGEGATAGTSKEEEKEEVAIAEVLHGERCLSLNDDELGLLEELARRLSGGGAGPAPRAQVVPLHTRT
jgi:hypothetical protein